MRTNGPSGLGEESPEIASETKPEESVNRIDLATQALRSLREGDRGVVAAASLGRTAIPALKELLFERDRSGLFETRRRAVDALASIGAHEVLIEFLQSFRESADPVERLGDDAVVNAAARALRGLDDPRVFDLLLALAKRKILPGVVAALGTFHRVESTPCLVAALAEDESRSSAEAALLDLGAKAREALAAAARSAPSGDRESEARLRQRRSALALLDRIGMERRAWPDLREIMRDRDPIARRLACQMCLTYAPEAERPEALEILNELSSTASTPERIDIQRALAKWTSRTR